jgi:hypothetical protein
MRPGNALTSHERTGEQPHCAVGSRRLDALLIRQPAPGNPRIRAGAPARMGLVVAAGQPVRCGADDYAGRPGSDQAGRVRVSRAGFGAGSGAVDLEVVADGGGDRLEVAFVGADHQVTPADGAFDDACIDDPRTPGQAPAQDRLMGIT